jgi:catechol 2,3-dioxygenase
MAVQEHDQGARKAKAEGFFAPRRLGHCNLYIGELERSMDFYINVVGLREAYRRPPIKAGFLNNGNTHHDIGMVDLTSKAARAKKAGLNHLAWELETQVDLLEGYRKSTAAGVDYDMTIDHEISHSVYFKDPDGNLNEIYADTGMRWYEKRYGNVMTQTIHWKPGDNEPSAETHYEPNPKVIRVENAVFHPVKITHACMVVEHFEESFDYYTRNIGLKPMIGGRDKPYAVLGGTTGMRDLSLFRATAERPAELHHMNFVVADEADLEKSILRAKKEKLKIITELNLPSRRSIVIADPDGLRIQFYSDRKGTLDLSRVDEDTAIYAV